MAHHPRDKPGHPLKPKKKYKNTNVYIAHFKTTEIPGTLAGNGGRTL